MNSEAANQGSSLEERRHVSKSSRRFAGHKYAVLMAYYGQGYLGMQRNPGCTTIEGELMRALVRAKAVPEAALESPRLVHFQRAARTDKSVSACGQCVSLCMDSDVTLDEINSRLSPDIRVLERVRVIKRFDAKLQCSARTYMYMMPSFAFSRADNCLTDTYRIDEVSLNTAREILQLYRGTHNFHNFTSRTTYENKSSVRYIMSVSCGEPFVRSGVEFVTISIKGQSFMMHQIRKMIGTCIAVCRGFASDNLIRARVWSPDQLDLPMAPGLGLVLEEVHYDSYNRRHAGKQHPRIDWTPCHARVMDFAERHIFSNIVSSEISTRSMFNWLSTLSYHTYDVRNIDTGDSLTRLQPSNDDCLDDDTQTHPGDCSLYSDSHHGHKDASSTTNRDLCNHGDDSTIDDACNHGDDSTIDDVCNHGDGSTIDDACNHGDDSTIDDACNHGDDSITEHHVSHTSNLQLNGHQEIQKVKDSNNSKVDPGIHVPGRSHNPCLLDYAG